MFRTNKFLMMKDVKIILSCLLKDFDSDDSLEGLIYAIRDLINLIDSHECLQRSIAELSKMKIQDQKHFENIALAVIKDVHQATSDLRKKIDCFPRLKEAINPTFFADIKNKVKLTEYPIEERPLLLIDPFLKLLRAVLDCGETENLITPYASIASNNDSKFIREIISPIISEHFVGTLSTFEEKEIWLYGIPGIILLPSRNGQKMDYPI